MGISELESFVKEYLLVKYWFVPPIKGWDTTSFKNQFNFFFTQVAGLKYHGTNYSIIDAHPQSHPWHSYGYPKKQVFRKNKCKHSDLKEHYEVFPVCIFEHKPVL